MRGRSLARLPVFGPKCMALPLLLLPLRGASVGLFSTRQGLGPTLVWFLTWTSIPRLSLCGKSGRLFGVGAGGGLRTSTRPSNKARGVMVPSSRQCAGCWLLVTGLTGLLGSAAHSGLLLLTASGRKQGFIMPFHRKSLQRIAGCVWLKAGATLLILILPGAAL